LSIGGMSSQFGAARHYEKQLRVK